jgi:hypothetical protein
MDWEYQSQPPVDHSSPFAKFSQKPPTCKLLARIAFAARFSVSAPPPPHDRATSSAHLKHSPRPKSSFHHQPLKARHHGPY